MQLDSKVASVNGVLGEAVLNCKTTIQLFLSYGATTSVIAESDRPQSVA